MVSGMVQAQRSRPSRTTPGRTRRPPSSPTPACWTRSPATAATATAAATNCTRWSGPTPASFSPPILAWQTRPLDPLLRAREISSHHDPRRRAAHHLAEPGPLIEAARPEEHEVIVAALGFVDRIRLEHTGPVLPRVADRGIEQQVLHAKTAVRPRDIAADHRPDRRVVDRLHDRRAPQLVVLLAWSKADPASRIAVGIADQSRHRPRVDQLAHPLLVRRLHRPWRAVRARRLA